MSMWNPEDLVAIGSAEELHIAARGDDGTLRSPVPIWVVRVGDEIYVRSYRGRGSGWFKHAIQHHEGHISAGGVESDVKFEESENPPRAATDAAYREKYSRFGAKFVDPMVTPEAVGATLRILPV